jgi:predicted DNA-binding protein with PD1-like motif
MFARLDKRGGAVTFASTDFGYVLFLEPGDELIRCLIQFARLQEVDAAVLQGAGTVTEVELGAGRSSDTDQRRRLAERLEPCFLTGTLTLVDGEPFPSMRGSFARADRSLVGGRVFQAVCGGSVELAVQVAAEAPVSHVSHTAHTSHSSHASMNDVAATDSHTQHGTGT